MQGTVSLGDDTVKWLLFQMVENPVKSYLAVFFLFVLFVVFKERARIFASLKYMRPFRKKKIQLQDILNHQLFKDLDFYVKEKINQLYDPDLHSGHDPVKLEIGKDLLKIKIKNSLDWLDDFVKNVDFSDPYLNVRSLFLHRREKNLAIQWSLYKEKEIPLLFVEKFIEITKINENYLMKSVDDLLSDKIPLTVYEKVYLVLGNLSSYFSTLLTDMIDVINCINGDLNGVDYHGKVIGGNKFKFYPVPDKTFVPLVEEKLASIALQLNATRVSICVFHDFENKEDIFSGYFSKIYEYAASGFKLTLNSMQYKSTGVIPELMEHFRDRKGCNYIYMNTNEILCSIMRHNGESALYAYPISYKHELKGFLLATFHSMEDYKTLDAEKTFELLKNNAFLLNHYLLYPEKPTHVA